MLIHRFAITTGSLLLMATATLAQAPQGGGQQGGAQSGPLAGPPAVQQPYAAPTAPSAGDADERRGGQAGMDRWPNESYGDRARGDGRRRDRRAETAEGIMACRLDMRDLCGDSQGGRGGRLQCLVERRDRVSPACADMLAAIEGRGSRGSRRAEGPRDGRPDSRSDGRGDGRDERRFDRREGDREPEMDGRRRFGGVRPGLACRADAETLCGTVERGPARRQCLTEHEAQLSAPCREALSEARTQRSEARRGPQDGDPR